MYIGLHFGGNMKKILSVSVLSFLALSLVSFARTTYNADNTIRYTNTIRSQREARLEKEAERANVHQAAAAAKINYNYDEFNNKEQQKNNYNNKR
jgi:hypothetical protein